MIEELTGDNSWEVPRRSVLVRRFPGSRGFDALASESDGTVGFPKKRPNLLFIFSDQQSYDMLGCYGNEQIITPNIDRFCSEGIRFNQCISNSPVCTPYRGSLMSGQHPLTCGTFNNDVQLLPGNGNYFAEVMHDAGYRTGYIGKWHIMGGRRDKPVPPGPLRYGFDDMFYTDNCTEEFRANESYYFDEKGQMVKYDTWQPYGQTAQALRFLDKCNQEDPFALFVSVHPPHNMGMKDGRFFYDTMPELMNLYDPGNIKLRSNVEGTPEIRRDYQGHMAMCTGIDTTFGWILDKLKQKGLDDNTIVIYTADHGDLLYSNGRPWPKGFAEDGSIRVPLIIRWPDRLKPRTSDLIVSTNDLMPTILAMMGLRVPETCQGLDLSRAIFKRRDDEVESTMIYFYPVGWRGIYTKRYTYAFDENLTHISFRCLYDRKDDPWQKKNLYDLPEHKALRDDLHRQTRKWMEKFGDTGASMNDIMGICLQGKNPAVKGAVDGVLSGRPVDLLRIAGVGD